MKDIKIVAPLSSVQELEMLHHYGADEIYCGVNTSKWHAHLGKFWWMNRRSPQGANLMTRDALEHTVQQAHALGIPVYITLNAPYYPQGALAYMVKMARILVNECDVDGLIISDINLLLALCQEEISTRIHLSSLGNCFNSYTVDFYRSLGIARIILPRQLRLSEIQGIVASRQDKVEFEVFALNDGCLFEEGFCLTSHAINGPFCLEKWDVDITPYGRASKGNIQDFNRHIQELREYLWFLNNCGSSFQQDGLPNGPCSMCFLGLFRDWGVTSVKIVGREASFYRKMTSLQLVKGVMDEVRKGKPPEEVAQRAQSLRNTPQYCQKGYMCYFRES